MKRDEIRKESTPISLEVIEEIRKRLDDFTPRQRVFAEFVLQNPESLVFLTITELAKKAGVSEATIVRFSNVIGYTGYAQLAREAQQAIQMELGTAGRFQLVRRMHKQSMKKPLSSAFDRVLRYEIDNLVNLSKSIKKKDFFNCVDMMAEADRICVVGCYASTSLADYLGYMLSKISHQIDIIHGQGVMTSAVLHRLTPKSLVFLISFPRYPKETTKLGHLAAEKGARIVAITNSHISPVVPRASLSFTLPVGMPSFLDTYAAPIVFINTLVTELSERDPENTQQALEQYDEYASQMDIFHVSRPQGKPVKNRKSLRKNRKNVS